MKLLVDLLQPRMFDMGIDLRGLNTGVSQHLLNQAQIRAAGQQMRSKAVPQTVRADIGLDPGPGGVQFDQTPQLDSV